MWFKQQKKKTIMGNLWFLSIDAGFFFGLWVARFTIGISFSGRSAAVESVILVSSSFPWSFVSTSGTSTADSSSVVDGGTSATVVLVTGSSGTTTGSSLSADKSFSNACLYCCWTPSHSDRLGIQEWTSGKNITTFSIRAGLISLPPSFLYCSERRYFNSTNRYLLMNKWRMVDKFSCFQ